MISCIYARIVINMRSIRTRTILLNVIAIFISIFVATLISAISIANLGHSSSEKELALLCESGKNKLNYNFESVRQTVDTVTSLIDEDLDSVSDDRFDAHVARAENVFEEAAANTNGVYTFYYRIDPIVTEKTTTKEKGFWYIKDGVDENTKKPKYKKSEEVTDLSAEKYQVEDPNSDSNTWPCRWFNIPKYKGEKGWLSPYSTETIDVLVVSYNAPVFRQASPDGEKEFIGVVGMEIDYKTMAELINNIRTHNSGYAFIVDSNNGTIVAHPDDLTTTTVWPDCPAGLLTAIKSESENHHVVYSYKGVEKHGYWLHLTNDMDIVVAVPISEINTTWLRVISEIVVAALIVIGVFIVVTILFTRRITKPLQELTEAAEKINRGDYDVKLDYKGNDEIGVLTTTVNRLVEHLGGYINDLNRLAYADTLTSVQNKSAFDVRLKEIQTRIDDPNDSIEFAIAIFDCDDLKQINDHYGHDKGNVYLRNSSHLICRVFENSDVYRIGGDEFAVILFDKDYKNRDKLTKHFIEKSAEICSFAKEDWEQIRVSVGVATFDPEIDKTAEDVAVHADHLMYASKRQRKKHTK